MTVIAGELGRLKLRDLFKDEDFVILSINISQNKLDIIFLFLFFLMC